MKIRQRDGTMREVHDGYTLRDGEAFVVGLPFMDARSMIHDGLGHPAGQRPGFMYSDANAQAERTVADAYVAYDEAIANRWRHGLPSFPLGRNFESSVEEKLSGRSEQGDVLDVDTAQCETRARLVDLQRGYTLDPRDEAFRGSMASLQLQPKVECCRYVR